MQLKTNNQTELNPTNGIKRTSPAKDFDPTDRSGFVPCDFRNLPSEAPAPNGRGTRLMFSHQLKSSSKESTTSKKPSEFRIQEIDPFFSLRKTIFKKNGGCWWSGLIVGANGFEVFHQRIASSFPHVHVHHVMIIFGTASHLRLGTQLEKKNMVKDSVTQQCGI
jgi:hypothetical protein